MSFVVQIWEQPDNVPRPTHVLEACDLVTQAHRHADPARPNARLKAFRRDILERWPVNAQADTPPDFGVWGDDSVSGDLGQDPVLVLEIATSRIDEVMAWLAEAGPIAGVNVADPQFGSAYLADGSVFALRPRGECAKAFARYYEGDDRAAWDRFVELAQRGIPLAFEMLGGMYHDGRFVGRDRVVAAALFAVANGWRVVDGAATPAAGPASESSASLAAYREALGADDLVASDALLSRLLESARLRETLLAAAHEFDARHVAALDLIAAGDVAAAAMRLQPIAARGHKPSQRTLANLWHGGFAKPDDPKQELAWTQAAAKLGDEAALLYLARLHEEGVLVKKDVRNARNVHRRLIRDGRSPAVRAASQAELRRLVGEPRKRFWEGRGATELQPLADQGDVAAIVELARVIEWGRTGAEIWDRVAPLWRRAAEAGDAEAQYQMGYRLASGRGVAKDDERATHWYGLAARQGHVGAQVDYARRLGPGLGIARDRNQSRHWLEQAATRRSPAGLRDLAGSYASGDLHPRDVLVAQVLRLLADRPSEIGSDDFQGADVVDPREVRRLLADIDGGADLLQTLARRTPATRPAEPPSGGGLSLAPIAPPPAKPSAPESAARRVATPAAAPAPRPRQRVASEPDPELEPEQAVGAGGTSSWQGAGWMLASFAVLSIAVLRLRRDAGANVVPIWLLGSMLAAVGAYRMARARDLPPVLATMEAAPMFVPFIGSGLALRLLWQRHRRG